jgi:23S rRNA (pseudouridine1915-N3)-methyltransferase
MKLALVYLKGQSSEWTDAACAEFSKKLSLLTPFEEIVIKAPSGDRGQASEKREAEGAALLKKLDKPGDKLILFDEKGREFENSRKFSEYLLKKIGSGSGRLIFAIGGPYGFSEEVRKHASETVTLSSLTMNHHVARVVALEQLYRALSIAKGLPYHND